MILKEWSEALDVYKATLDRLSRELKAIRYNVKSSGRVWAAVLVPTLLSALFVFITPHSPYKKSTSCIPEG